MSRRKRGRSKPHQGIAKGKAAAKVPSALVDICISVYGEWAMLKKCFDCIPAATEGLEGGYRIILIDNGTPDWQNSDGEMVSVEEQAADVKALLRPQDQFIRVEDNVGYPVGMNTAASKGRSPLILILTADVYMEPGSITTMVKELDDPEIGVVGPLLLFPKDESPHGPSNSVQSAGIAFSIRGEPFHIFIGWTRDNPRVVQRREMQALTGACFLTRRNLWQQVGGFAAVYNKGTYEDMELCFSIRQLGSKVIFQPAAKGFHYVGGSVLQGANKGGFPLSVNATIFKGRWASRLVWDEYKYW